MATTDFDVIIVGGAAVGSAVAYFLGKQPDFSGTVLVIEKDATYQHSATALSAASIRHQFSTVENIQMSLFGTQFLRAFKHDMAVAGEAPDPAFCERGYLFLADSPEGESILQQNQQRQNACGADIALLTPAAMDQRFPWLNTDDLYAGSLGLSGEGWLDAYGMMQGMRRKAIELGVQYRQDEVVEILHQGGRVTGVHTAQGQKIQCQYLVNAAGIGARALAEQLGIDLPIEARKRSVFYFHSPAQLPDCPMVIDPTGAYFRPEGEGFITGIAPNPEDDPECTDFNVQHELFEEVLWPILAHRVPQFEALRLMHSWAGHYDMNTVDHNVILGCHPSFENCYFANGFSGHGMQQAPAVGRAISELITYGSYQSLDLSRLGWGRILANEPIIELNVV